METVADAAKRMTKKKKMAGAMKMKKDDKYSPSDRGGKIGIGKIKKKTMGKAKKPMGMK